MLKKIATIAIAAMMGASALVGMSACGGKNEKELVIGYTEAPPMNYTENGELLGFDTEFAKLVCEELGYTPKFVEINWNNKIIDLQAKNIDLIWNGMTIRDELKESMAISDPYMENKQVVVAKKDVLGQYTDIASLAAADSIAVESGSAGETVATDNGYGDKVRGAEKQADCILEVEAGTSSVAIVDLTLAKTMTGEGTSFTDLGYVEVGFAGELYGIGMRKEDTELLASINALIAKYKADGTLDALAVKYNLK